MSAIVLLSGTLFRDPEKRIAKNGKPFFVATLKVRDGSEVSWFKLRTFSEPVGAELLELGDGDSLSATGRLEVTTYVQAGETRVRLACLVDRLLTLPRPTKTRATKKATKAAAPAPRRAALDRHAGANVGDFSDAVPF